MRFSCVFRWFRADFPLVFLLFPLVFSWFSKEKASFLVQVEASDREGRPLNVPTSKAVAAAPPFKTNFPPTPKRPIVFSPPQGRTLGEEDEIEIVYHDPKYSGPTQVKKEPGISISSDASRPPEGVAAGLFGANLSNKRGGFPVPTQRFSPTDLGPDEAVHLAAFCCTGCRSLESEGGTHADALWLGWLHLASR